MHDVRASFPMLSSALSSGCDSAYRHPSRFVEVDPPASCHDQVPMLASAASTLASMKKPSSLTEDHSSVGTPHMTRFLVSQSRSTSVSRSSVSARMIGTGQNAFTSRRAHVLLAKSAKEDQLIHDHHHHTDKDGTNESAVTGVHNKNNIDDSACVQTSSRCCSNEHTRANSASGERAGCTTPRALPFNAAVVRRRSKNAGRSQSCTTQTHHAHHLPLPPQGQKPPLLSHAPSRCCTAPAPPRTVHQNVQQPGVVSKTHLGSSKDSAQDSDNCAHDDKYKANNNSSKKIYSSAVTHDTDSNIGVRNDYTDSHHDYTKHPHLRLNDSQPHDMTLGHDKKYLCNDCNSVQDNSNDDKPSLKSGMCCAKSRCMHSRQSIREFLSMQREVRRCYATMACHKSIVQDLLDRLQCAEQKAREEGTRHADDMRAMREQCQREVAETRHRYREKMRRVLLQIMTHASLSKERPVPPSDSIGLRGTKQVISGYDDDDKDENDDETEVQFCAQSDAITPSVGWAKAQTTDCATRTHVSLTSSLCSSDPQTDGGGVMDECRSLAASSARCNTRDKHNIHEVTQCAGRIGTYYTDPAKEDNKVTYLQDSRRQHVNMLFPVVTGSRALISGSSSRITCKEIASVNPGEHTQPDRIRELTRLHTTMATYSDSASSTIHTDVDDDKDNDGRNEENDESCTSRSSSSSSVGTDASIPRKEKATSEVATVAQIGACVCCTEHAHINQCISTSGTLNGDGIYSSSSSSSNSSGCPDDYCSGCTTMTATSTIAAIHGTAAASDDATKHTADVKECTFDAVPGTTARSVTKRKCGGAPLHQARDFDDRWRDDTYRATNVNNKKNETGDVRLCKHRDTRNANVTRSRSTSSGQNGNTSSNREGDQHRCRELLRALLDKEKQLTALAVERSRYRKLYTDLAAQHENKIEILKHS